MRVIKLSHRDPRIILGHLDRRVAVSSISTAHNCGCRPGALIIIAQQSGDLCRVGRMLRIGKRSQVCHSKAVVVKLLGGLEINSICDPCTRRDRLRILKTFVEV